MPVRFSKTYYVDARSPIASDRNPGTRARPFATIDHAAQILQPGERVVVASGVYRERIRPAHGGTGPSLMISYEAAPGATVVLKGSRVFHGLWTFEGGLWKAPLNSTSFQEYNPFAIDNVTSRQFDTMYWARELRGMPPYNLPRGLVFQDGRLLAQRARLSDLDDRPGSYWVDRKHQVLYVHLLGDARPERTVIEITTQETVFAPEKIGLGYIRVKGFTVEQAAGPFPWEQVGAISTTRGHHWIIEDNTVRWVNGVGIDVGINHPGFTQPEQVGYHIVRRNTVTDCGICGICGFGPDGGRTFGLLIEDNILLRNAFYDVERLYETGGIKTHNNIGCLISHNLVVDTIHGPGIWLDWDNRNSRCCRNVVVNSHTQFGGIFVEASNVPNLFDHNIIWGTKGAGFYEHDCCRQVFVHNFVARSTGPAFFLRGKQSDRLIDGKPIVVGFHAVEGNILFQNGLPDDIRGEPSQIEGNLTEGISAKLSLASWDLTWSVKGKVAPVPRLAAITRDFEGRLRRGDLTAPGPFATLPTKPTPMRLFVPEH
ncbi:MAG TPA: right-handed parallel beta-helix repeat-containing protein [Chthonomonadaceae bacterium]|nr:right-handed parallel beta-helix repeat-containing protein [Chthonomonadaceae bacterium]